MSNTTNTLEEKVVESNSHLPRSENIVRCHFCKEEFALAQGTILYDGEWFHEKCWDHFEKEMIIKS